MMRVVTCVLMTLSVSVHAQVLENIHAELIDGTIRISYDLIGPPTGLRVNVRAYASHDSFSRALTGVTGDVGRMRPGYGKMISWNPGTTLHNFNGELSFELRGDVIADYEFLPPSSKSVRRGKPNVIRWKGGLPTDNVRIEFKHENDQPIWNIAMQNSAMVEWVPPRKGDCGKGYVYRLTSEDGTVISGTYRLRHKVARIWLWAPWIAALGVATYIYFEEYGPLPDPPNSPD